MCMHMHMHMHMCMHMCMNVTIEEGYVRRGLRLLREGGSSYFLQVTKFD